MAPQTRSAARIERFSQPVVPNAETVSEIEIRETIEVVKQVSVRETRQRKAKKPSSKKVPTKTDDGVSLKEFGRPASVVVAEPKRPIMKKRKLAQKNTNSEEASLEIIIDGDKELAGNLKVPDTVVETFEFDNEYSLDDDENTDSQSDSSSAEDSEDDYELEMGIKRKEASSDSDSSIHASNVDNEHYKMKRSETKMERKLKKSRLFSKKNREEEDSEDDGIICEFESTTIQKDRKKRLFRRKMLRLPGQTKRRRIRRANVDVTDEYTCDTFAEFGSTLNVLTKKIRRNDPDVNKKALRKVFIELGIDSEKSYDEQSDEDEADIICKRLDFYNDRNSKERVEQISYLNINPFVEKLSGYDNRKAEQGNGQLCSRNYHPVVFNKGNDWKLSEALVWERPYDHVLFQEAKFDPSSRSKWLINKATQERNAQLKNQLLEQFRETARKKLLNLKIAAHMKTKCIDSHDDIVTNIQDDMMLLNRPTETHSMPAEEVEMLKYNENRSDDEDDIVNSLHFGEDIFA